MLGKTTISGIRSVLLLAQHAPGTRLSPRRLAEMLDESPTYLAKVTRHLVRSGILEAEKGVKGGVRLLRAPAEITLLQIVEACQGTIIGDYCRPADPNAAYCNYHRATLELHEAVTGVLGRWTLAKLLERPYSFGVMPGGHTCFMASGLKEPPAPVPPAPILITKVGPAS
jgi:Rrf2 family protein